MECFDSETLKPIETNSRFARFLKGKACQVKFYKDDKKAVILYHSPWKLIVYDIELDLIESENSLMSLSK